MPQTKTLQQREKELQSLLATPAGREELQQLETRYHAANGRLRPQRTSVITYILVHERERGLIQLRCLEETMTTLFSVGDQVIIRFGRHQGQKATILQTQPAHVYKVKLANGFILFYSGKGLTKEPERVPLSG